MNKEVKSTLRNEVVSWAKTVVFAVVFAICINNFVIVNATVPTGSMENTIMPGDRIVANRLAYLFHPPQRFDIVVFPFPDDETQLYVKRVIGLPGETVTVRDGKVYINDDPTPLKDTFVRETPTGNYGPFVVPAGHYFMMGDNRNTSYDSRFWNDKYVDAHKILGKVLLKYYPGVKLLYNSQ